ncbi:hypothetical protein G7B40_017660 [Aetokthonos hydrillicola Thurmond2011]|jgi:hypothetical protein|uniref:PEP-CTERM sorting domain-containing protein n=1 Tax=Aetokthonos hydrillicola Thurmond2011 TaxID=2712845 RepID=A0AAP5I7M8_9CYAN|nr:hypothetical protein [Aetokthonos hydrillicola]MBO3458190.1 hypothetical protein [Aetokthonos hydrillicola CCALA 1050]MBW4584410.1 hypothetical protein [Aetokthonos hydrillicola CCALA 1050]MDR9896371.1 hypothetical protein [Aetokthonos hydrillicola Thurmond2011]
MKNFFSQSAIAAGVVLSSVLVSHPATASSFFEITVENPGVQKSALANDSATGVYVENFDSKSTTYNNGISFAGNSSVGTYDNAQVVLADQFGGVRGKGNYLTVHPGRAQAPSTYTKSTLTLKKSQRYFGLWWSAGDENNEMDFYSGNTLLQKFTTADVISFINQQPNQEAYYGNPNSKFKGQDSREPFAFLNFFADPNDSKVTFDRIEFINSSSNSGFESDNHTIAAEYTKISGKRIVVSTPEPSGAVALGIIAGICLLFRNRRVFAN